MSRKKSKVSDAASTAVAESPVHSMPSDVFVREALGAAQPAVAELELPRTPETPLPDVKWRDIGEAPRKPPTFQTIPLSALSESSTNPRRSFDKVAMDELTASVRERGVLEPILVRLVQIEQVVPDGESPGPQFACYEVVAGARRFRAAKAAGLADIPCMVHDWTDKQALEAQVVENLQRTDLSPLEEARGYQLLMKRHGYTAEALRDRIHKSLAYVYGRLKLLELPPAAMKLLESGEIDPSRALLVARIPVAKLAEQAAKEIVGLSYREAKACIEEDFMLRLADVAWPTGDEKLLPEAGSCGKCPKRTGNDRLLFGDVEDGNLCTDAKCFQAKCRAWADRRAAEVKASGGDVLVGDAAKKASYANNLLHLDDCCYSDSKQRSYRQLLGKDAAAVPLTLLVFDDGETREMAPRSICERKLRETGALPKERSAASPAATKANAKAKLEEAAHKRRMKAAQLAMPDLREAAGKVGEKELLEFVLDRLASAWNTRDPLKAAQIGCGYDGLTKAGRAAVAKLALPRLRALVVECLIAERASNVYPPRYAAGWSAAVALTGIKMSTYEAQATPQAKEKPKGKEKTKATKPTKAKATKAAKSTAPKGGRKARL